MKKGKTELEKMQDKVQKMVVRVNEKITILGEHLGILNTTLTNIQEEFDKIQNIPNEEKMRYEELKQIRLNWKNQVDEIIKKYEEIKNKDATAAGVAGVGIGAGVAVAALGPGVAMGIAYHIWCCFNRNCYICFEWCCGYECRFGMDWRRCTCSRWRWNGCRRSISCFNGAYWIGYCRSWSYSRGTFILEK